MIHDDIDIQLGRIKFQKGGGAGGHNGIKSIIESLNTPDFYRLRVGIKSNYEGDLSDYVLSLFSEEEKDIVEKVLELSSQAVKLSIRRNIETAMNEYNGKKITINKEFQN